MQKPDQESVIFIQDAESLNQTQFFGDIIANLAKSLEETVGLNDAEGYIANVGEVMGEQISQLYNDGKPVSKTYISQVLVDLKQRIGGEFKIAEITDDTIVLTNTRCPFGERVYGKKSLCMMTTNVFGTVASDRNGYAHVAVEEAIAENHEYCRVIISLNPNTVKAHNGTEFYGD